MKINVKENVNESGYTPENFINALDRLGFTRDSNYPDDDMAREYSMTLPSISGTATIHAGSTYIKDNPRRDYYFFVELVVSNKRTNDSVKVARIEKNIYDKSWAALLLSAAKTYISCMQQISDLPNNIG